MAQQIIITRDELKYLVEQTLNYAKLGFEVGKLDYKEVIEIETRLNKIKL